MRNDSLLPGHSKLRSEGPRKVALKSTFLLHFPALTGRSASLRKRGQ